jgi:hypothetical protein
MNITKLNLNILGIFLIIFICITFLYILLIKYQESFINYPEQINPLSKYDSDVKSNVANNNYTSLLMYIKSNPYDSFKFIKDIQTKFFDNNCNIKTDIDFKNIEILQHGLPFGSK